jgi:hypothetical protein
MDKNQQIQTIQKPSVLDQFTLDFEYNKTPQEVKREIRARTHKG